jgi:hypothetical protein
MKLLNILLCFLVLSCGDSDEQIRKNLMISANIAMGSGDCDKAIELMTSIDQPKSDGEFIKILALSYACKAKFNVTTFLTDDLQRFDDSGTFNGTTLFSTSDDVISADDEDFTYLQLAMDTILYAGGLDTEENPTSTKRGEIFSNDELNELEMLLVYLQLISMGRFFNYYGDANTDGEKTGCLIQYENVSLDGGSSFDAVLGTGALDLGSCTLANYKTAGVGNSDLGTPGSYNVKRLCHGVMIINNFFHVFPSLIARISGADFDNIASMENVLTLITQFMETQKTGVSDNVSDVLSQTRCETLNASDDDFLQVYYLFLMEKVFI